VAAGGRSLPFGVRSRGSSRGGGVARCTLETEKKKAMTTSKVVEGDGSLLYFGAHLQV
jgi:hypothetical protein